MDYAALAATTHFVERSVKIYNFCSNKSRSEERVSQLAICYNITHDVNQLTKEIMIEEKKKRGQHYKDESCVKAVGKAKNKTLLQNVLERHNKIELVLKKHPELMSIYKDIVDTISFDQASSFKLERQNERFNQEVDAMKKTRKPNKIEKEKGVEFTPAVMGKVRFFDAKKNHEDGIKAELMVRGFTDFSSLPNITACKNKLKEMMVARGETEKNNIKEIKHFPILSTYDWSVAIEIE